MKVVGGRHPSEYSGSAWPKGVDRADFKPITTGGARTFGRDQAAKRDETTCMPRYDPNSGKLVP